MELLSSPSSEYLLFASLESLHAESIAWNNEVAFWQQELSFFYKVLHRKWSIEPFPSIELANLEKELIDITSGDMLKVKDQVGQHERSLAALMKNKSLQEENEYREQHKVIMENIHVLYKRIKTYKLNLFEAVTHY